MKKRIAALLTALLVCLLPLSLPVNAAAEKQHVTLSFGDSIAKGYGLENYQMLSSLTEDSYLYLWAEEYDELESKTASGFARTGYTSQQILTSIQDTDEKTLASATEVFISAGGNDVMDCYGQMIYRVVTGNPELLSEYGLTLDISSDTAVERTIISTLIDPTKQELVKQIAALCTGEEAQKEYDSLVSAFQTNLKEMIKAIRAKNKEADIVILPPYDPLSALTLENDLLTSVGNTLTAFDKAAKDLLNDSSVNDKLHIISLLDAFDGKYHEMTNIDLLDIHPNKAGHAEIFRFLKAELSPASAQDAAVPAEAATQETVGASADKPADASQDAVSVAVTNIPAEETASIFPPAVTYVLFGAACACVAAIIIVFIVRRIKSKKSGK